MMKPILPSILLAMIALVGCGSEADSGDGDSNDRAAASLARIPPLMERNDSRIFCIGRSPDAEVRIRVDAVGLFDNGDDMCAQLEIWGAYDLQTEVAYADGRRTLLGVSDNGELYTCAGCGVGSQRGPCQDDRYYELVVKRWEEGVLFKLDRPLQDDEQLPRQCFMIEIGEPVG